MPNYRDRMAYRIDCLTQENRFLRKQLASAMEQLADRDITIKKLTFSLDEIDKILHSSKCIDPKRDVARNEYRVAAEHDAEIRRLQPREIMNAWGIPIDSSGGGENEISR